MHVLLEQGYFLFHSQLKQALENKRNSKTDLIHETQQILKNDSDPYDRLYIQPKLLSFHEG